MRFCEISGRMRGRRLITRPVNPTEHASSEATNAATAVGDDEDLEEEDDDAAAEEEDDEEDEEGDVEDEAGV
jgi:hypothetical protein